MFLALNFSNASASMLKGFELLRRVSQVRDNLTERAELDVFMLRSVDSELYGGS